jgi:hypothetical protein
VPLDRRALDRELYGLLTEKSRREERRHCESQLIEFFATCLVTRGSAAYRHAIAHLRLRAGPRDKRGTGQCAKMDIG